MNPFRRRTRSVVALAALAAAAATVTVPTAAQAASSDFCTGGGFQLVLPGRTVTARPGQDLRTTIPARDLGTSFLVQGEVRRVHRLVRDARRHQLDAHRRRQPR